MKKPMKALSFRKKLIIFGFLLSSLLLITRTSTVIYKLSAPPKVVKIGGVRDDQLRLIEGYLSKTTVVWNKPIGLKKGSMIHTILLGSAIKNSVTIASINGNGVFDVVVTRNYRGTCSSRRFVMRVENGEVEVLESSSTMN